MCGIILSSVWNYPGKDLNAAQTALLSRMAWYATKETGQNIYPSISTLSSQTKLSKSTIIRSLAYLLKNGFIIEHQKSNKAKHLSTNYTINISRLSVEETKTSKPTGKTKFIRPAKSLPSVTITPGANVTMKPGASVTMTPNTRLIKTININNNSHALNNETNSHIKPTLNVVVGNGIDMLELKGCKMDELIALGMSRKVSIETIKEYSITRIAEAILDSTNPKVRDRAGHIVSFLKEGWSLRSSKNKGSCINADAENSKKILASVDALVSNRASEEVAKFHLDRLRGRVGSNNVTKGIMLKVGEAR